MIHNEPELNNVIQYSTGESTYNTTKLIINVGKFISEFNLFSLDIKLLYNISNYKLYIKVTSG